MPMRCLQNHAMLVAGIVATDHYIKVPLVHGGPPGGEMLEVFVRELVQPSLPAPRGNRPALLYLQGALDAFKAVRGSGLTYW